MKLKILAIALFATTVAAIVFHPGVNGSAGASLLTPSPANAHLVTPPGSGTNQIPSAAKVEVVFVLDTTGSMTGLIQTAKDKIWSIATTMAAAKPTPEIRIGLVAFRDRGDAYVTKVVDLSDDLDSVYAALMDFEADGGGDTPESVNQALSDAIHNVSWSQDQQAYRAVFLVGDAPPHMDYPNDTPFPVTLAEAERRNIFVNTIQCGDHAGTVGPWQQIAQLGHGRFFEVDQAGGAVALATPYDDEIATLSAKLDNTRMYYGSEEEKAKMRAKVAATRKLEAGASIASRARRAVFNSSEAGKGNFLGESELIDAVASGAVKLDEIDANVLPADLQNRPVAEQQARIATVAAERDELRSKIKLLAKDRQDYMEKKVKEEGGAGESLDQQIYETVVIQADELGLKYRSGPQY